MKVLSASEMASGQLINKTKSAIYMHHSTSMEVVNKVQRITVIGRQELPFTYLGCPIFYSRRKNRLLPRLDQQGARQTSIMER